MHNARESMANGVMAKLWARMASAMPGTLRSHTACVASGVTSRSDRPLPPQVRTISASMVSHASTMAVLILSNIVISLIKNFIPDKVRIPAFIVVIASFVTIVQMLMQAFVPALYATLGVFIPLIVVNCIILGRAEAFASKNNAFDSALDGLGIGLGFTLSLTVIGTIRELLGSGAVFGYSLGTADYMPLVFVLAPGGFLVLGYLMVVFNKLAKK